MTEQELEDIIHANYIADRKAAKGIAFWVHQLLKAKDDEIARLTGTFDKRLKNLESKESEADRQARYERYQDHWP